MPKNSALEKAPYTVTVVKGDELVGTVPCGNSNNAEFNFHKIARALGGVVEDCHYENGYIEVGDFTVYYVMSVEADDILEMLKV